MISMKMIFRWFGDHDDSVSLAAIRQIPGIYGVASALQDIPAGEVWPLERIMTFKNRIAAAGLTLEVIESVNIHDDIKIGLPSRDQYIANYRLTIRNLSQAGIKVICYNFMPVFDWVRSDLAMPLADASTVLSYQDKVIRKTEPSQMFKMFENSSNDFSLPGWEPERLAELKTLFAKYRGLTAEQLLANLKYFLEQIIPTCEECNVKMALHPDDPPWSIFGLPRIVNTRENIQKIVDLVDSPNNGLTICSGSLGANPANNLPEIIRHFGKLNRIHFAHVRNVKRLEGRDFHETSHLSAAGSLDMFAIMKAYHDIGFTGYIRPDHGRMIWGEQARPGYGLYDRALGITYLNGLWEAIEKMESPITNSGV
jgi:mannonate dehydratase